MRFVFIILAVASAAVFLGAAAHSQHHGIRMLQDRNTQGGSFWAWLPWDNRDLSEVGRQHRTRYLRSLLMALAALLACALSLRVVTS